MSNLHIPWLTDWDEKMINILSQITRDFETPPKLSMLFFANTFPIAYHYAIALKKAGKAPNDFISSGVWGAKEEDNLISYTNDAQSLGRLNVPVSIFKPCYAFVPLTLATSRIRDDIIDDFVREKKSIKTTPPLFSISDFLEKAKDKKYNYDEVVIYAELKELGCYLKSFIENKFRNPTVFVGQGLKDDVILPVCGLIKAVPSMLRVFIYGGSLSAYLLRKEDRYLSLDIDDNGSNVNEMMMKTYVSCPPPCFKLLKSYHEQLYNAARAESYKDGSKTCLPFYTVYRSYNEIAWLFQHRSSFKNAEEFARCLRDHYKELN